MCFDPITAGLTLAAGTGLSIAGKMGEQSQQIGAQAREMNARNTLLANHLNAAKRYGAESQAAADNLIGGFSPSNGAAEDEAAAAKRMVAVRGNIVDPNFDVAAGGTTDFVKNAAAERVRKSFNRATGIAAATAKLGGKYEDAWGNRENRILGGSRDVAIVNDLAKADMATLGPEQDLAAYGVYRVPSAWPSVAQSVGGFLGSLAGSGYLGPQPPKPA